MFNIGSQLRNTRKKANLTLDQLAASSGVDRGTISRIELGHVSPRIDTIGFLCEAMDTDLSRFFSAEESVAAADGSYGQAHRDGAPANPSPENLGFATAFPAPLKDPERADAAGYWPVPSTFWRGLLEVLERFEILIKNSREMILVKDAQGTILYTSPPCEEILGYRPHELVGLRIQTLMHPDDLPGYEVCLAGLAQQAGASRTLDYRVRRKDGNWCLVSSKLTNQLDNPSVRALVVNSMKVQAS